jgi:hypothetical protein
MSPERDRDAVPWLLVAAAAAVVTVVAAVVAIARTDSSWWVVAAIALVLAGTAASAVGVARLTNRRRRQRPVEVHGATAHGPPPEWRGPQGSPHLLVVASEPVDRAALGDGLGQAVPEGAAVLVVAPAIPASGLRYWVSDTDAARRRAAAVERASVAALREAGVAADGHVGAGDALTAIEDALRFFAPELIVLLVHRTGGRHARELPPRSEVERRFGVPVAEVDPPRTRRRLRAQP